MIIEAFWNQVTLVTVLWKNKAQHWLYTNAQHLHSLTDPESFKSTSFRDWIHWDFCRLSIQIHSAKRSLVNWHTVWSLFVASWDHSLKLRPILALSYYDFLQELHPMFSSRVFFICLFVCVCVFHTSFQTSYSHYSFAKYSCKP